MKKTNVLYLFLLLTTSVSAKSISELSPYPKFCGIAAKEDLIFQDFKRNPVYQHVLEHLDFKQGLDYLEVIEQSYPFILDKLEKYKENDSLGNPVTYSYGENYGVLSPTTLRYMKIAGELVFLFGDLSHKKIIEIGGGYGGQCKILSDLIGFYRYTFIDLPECCLLTEKYLNSLNIKNIHFINTLEFSNSNLQNPNNEIFLAEQNDSIKPFQTVSTLENPTSNEISYDLVISNYAFSEVTIDEQMNYITKIINNSKMGYMICNFTSDFFSLSSLTLNQILSSINLPSRTIYVLAEIPNTYPNNVLIIWQETSEATDIFKKIQQSLILVPEKFNEK